MRPQRSQALPLLPLLLGLALLAGCAGRNYRAYAHGVGFSDAQVAKDTWEVSYTGPADYNELLAKKMAILRAAELTKLSGRRWFRITDQDTDARKVRRVSREVTREPVKDTLFPAAEAPHVVKETTTREDAWIPTATLVFETLPEETGDSLDADSVLREGRAAGLLPKRKG